MYLAPCFFRSCKLRLGFFNPVAGQAGHVEITHFVRHQLRGNLRKRDIRASQRELLRIRITKPQDRYLDGGVRLSAKQLLGIRQRHVAGGNAIDALDQVAGGDVGFLSRRTGQRVNNRHIPVPLRQDQTNPGFGRILRFFILPVLIGVQIAGKGIDRFEKTVDCAERDALHVRLFDVFQLDAFENLCVDLQVPVNIVCCNRAPTCLRQSEVEQLRKLSCRQWSI